MSLKEVKDVQNALICDLRDQHFFAYEMVLISMQLLLEFQDGKIWIK